MDNLASIQSLNINYNAQETYTKDDNTESYSKTEELSITMTSAAVYEKSSDEDDLAQVTYKPDMDKVNAMIEETDRRLIDLFRNTVKKGTLKQLGGFRGFLDRFRSGEIETTEVEFEITEEVVEKAKEETGPDGYWGAEQTSDRFLEFAQALSGDDPSKAEMLLEAVKEGFKMAEEIWGGELPELSQNTLEMTIKKFEAWRDGTEYVPEVATEELVDETASNIVGQIIQEA